MSKREKELLDALMLCRLRCGYILNYCPGGADQMRGEAEEMLRVINGTLTKPSPDGDKHADE